MSRVLPALAGIAAAVALAIPASASTAAAVPVPATETGTSFVSTYTGSPADEAATKAFYQAVMKSAEAKRAKAGNPLAAVTVVYDPSRAPRFASQISRSAQIWNNATNNVTLVAGNSSNDDFYYREGNSSRGSYASTDGHGHGFIFIDYRQAQQYDSLRITSHETGHVLGLPDHYSGPCSELMSGGGPGPSCTNAYPNRTEASRVDYLWRNG